MTFRFEKRPDDSLVATSGRRTARISPLGLIWQVDIVDEMDSYVGAGTFPATVLTKKAVSLEEAKSVCTTWLASARQEPAAAGTGR